MRWACATFRRMGVQLLDGRGQLRGTEELMADVANAFARVPDSARRTAAAVALFGEAGVGLVPLLSQGALGLRVMQADARRLGLVMTDAQKNALTNFGTQMRRLAAATQGVSNAIAVRLAPILAPLVADFTNWIAANRELIATRVEEYIRAIPDLIQSLRDQVSSLWQTVKPFVSTLGEWAEAFGVVNTVALGLGLYLGGGLVASVGKLMIAVGAPAIAAITAFAKALRAGATVTAAFNAVLLANPIGVVVAAVALLGGGAYLLYRNWGGVVAFFRRVWDGIKGALNAARLPEFAGRLWDDFKTPFVAIAGWVAGWAAGPITQAVNAFKEAWQSVPAFFEGLWDGVKAKFDAVLGWLQPIIDRIERLLPSLPSNAGQPTPRSQPGPARPGTVNGARRIEGWDTEDGAAPAVRPISPAAGARVDTGGKLEITVKDGRVDVTRAEPNDRRTEFRTSTSTGAYMAMP